MKYIKTFENINYTEIPLLKDLLIEEMHSLGVNWQDLSTPIQKKNRNLVLKISVAGMAKLLKYSKYSTSKSKIINSKLNRLFHDEMFNYLAEIENSNHIDEFFKDIPWFTHDTFYIYHHYLKKTRPHVRVPSSGNAVAWDKESIDSIESAISSFITNVLRTNLELTLNYLMTIAAKRDYPYLRTIISNAPEGLANILLDSSFPNTMPQFIRYARLSANTLNKIVRSDTASAQQKDAAVNNVNYDAIDDILSDWE